MPGICGAARARAGAAKPAVKAERSVSLQAILRDWLARVRLAGAARLQVHWFLTKRRAGHGFTPKRYVTELANRHH